MSLFLQISAIEEKSSFIVNDCTGTDENGWGGNNERIKDISSAILEIRPPSLPDGDKPYTVDVTGNFPNEDGFGYEVFPGMVNAEKIESGLWKIKLIIEGEDKKGKPFKKSAITEVVFTSDVECCVDKHMKDVNANAFNDEKQKKIIELNNLLESVCYSKDCGLDKQADKIIKYILANCNGCLC